MSLEDIALQIAEFLAESGDAIDVVADYIEPVINEAHEFFGAEFDAQGSGGSGVGSGVGSGFTSIVTS